MTISPPRTRSLAGTAALAAAALAGCAGNGPPAIGPAPDEEVSVGYGTRAKEDVTGAITSIVPGETQRDVFSVAEMLEGRVPGLEVLRRPNGDYGFRIRGAFDPSGAAEPLLVIDGMPIAPDLVGPMIASLDPDDVVRIDVLKDVGSTAVYGTRAYYGVIIISTRHGR